MPLLTTRLAEIASSRDPHRHLSSLGEVFARFEDQDSGCLSYGVATDGARWFVKLAPDAATATTLRSAARFHTAVNHRAILAPLAFADLSEQAGIIYPWATGAVLYHPTKSRRVDRTAPTSPMRAFRTQPLAIVTRVVEEIFDAHLAVAHAGYATVDFYDGCMLYDPQTTLIRLIDLDNYRPAPFTVGPQLLPGSRRYLSPEERTAGSIVDERTMVYTLGRTALILMDEGDTEQAWRGTPTQREVLLRATMTDPAERYRGVDEFVSAWHAA